MKLNTFKRLKLVLFDFDDTLAVHEGHLSCSKLTYLTCIHSDNTDPWKGTKKNVQLEKFMNLCVKNNIEIGLISATTSYTAGKRKEEWVLDNYGIACENFCVGDSEQKLSKCRLLPMQGDWTILKSRSLMITIERLKVLRMQGL